MALSSQLTKFKAPGTKILTEVIEQVPDTPAPNGARLLVINSRKGPVNHPILVANFTTYEILFDKISDADERRGNWGARSAEQMLAVGPIYVLNLRAFDNTLDLAGLQELSAQGDVDNIGSSTIPYSSLYSTSQFWKVDPKQLIKQSNTDNLLVLGNVGPSSLSIFIRKTKTNQTSLTFDQWYKNLNREIPSYVNPFDRVQDYIVDIFIFNNKFDTASFNNPSYGYVFDASGNVKKSVVNQSAITVDGLTQLSQIPESGFLDSITGSLVQNFTDEYGNNFDAVSLLNNRIQEFGLVAKINDSILDTAGSWVEGDLYVSNGKKKPTPIDLLGHSLMNTTAIGTFDVTGYQALTSVESLSYKFNLAVQTIPVTTSTLDSLAAIASTSSIVQHNALLGSTRTVSTATGNYTLTLDAGPTGDLTWAGDDLDDVEVDDYITLSGFVTTTTMNTKYVVNSVGVGTMNITALDASVIVTETADVTVEWADIDILSRNVLYVSGSLTSKLGDKYVAQDGNLASIIGIEHQGTVNDVNVFKLTFDKNLILNSTVDQSTALDLSTLGENESTSISLDDSTILYVHAGPLYAYKVISYEDVITTYQPINLAAYTPRAAQFLDGTKDRQTSILNTLIDTELRDALSNYELIRFNYIVDGFKSYIEPNCKAQLRQIAEDRKLCRAICNMPSIYDFQNSTNPYFTDSIGGKFMPMYIAQGGNSQLPYTTRFSLPNVNGWYAYFFGPNIQLSNGKTMPPAAIVSNLFARKYTSSKPYAILAGLDGVLSGRGVSGVEHVFNEKNDGTGDRDYLDPFGYNVILIKNGVLQVYGNKTANTLVANPMMAIHTSEVVMYIQERVKSLLERFVFKYNNAQNRLVIKEEADSICAEPLGDGAISDFVNQMDELNNTAEVIKNRIGILDTTIYDNSGMEILVHRTKIDSITNSATFEILQN